MRNALSISVFIYKKVAKSEIGTVTEIFEINWNFANFKSKQGNQ